MALRQLTTIEIEQLDDVELATRAAAGDPRAFEVLYRRYADAAWRMAQAVGSDPDDSADAVSEAFANLLAALVAGRLQPDIPFRPYLLVATRNAAIDQHRRRSRLEPIGDRPDAPAPEPTPGEKLDASVNASLLCVAFRSLPERWRSVLWMTEVEGIPPREVGALMGLTPNSAAQLARRAREGLRDRYLQAHVGAVSNAECAVVASQLGSFTAGTLSARMNSRVEAHLRTCEDCRERVAELADVGRELRGIVVPIPAFLGFTAWEAVRRRFPQEAGHTAAWGAEQITRAVAISTAVLLTLGLTTAGLMSGGGGVTPVAGNRSGGAVAIAPATNVSQLPDDTSVNGGGTRTRTGTGATNGAPGGSPTIDVSKNGVPPTGPNPPSPPAGPNPTSPPKPPTKPPASPGSGLGLVLTTNLGVATASASVSLSGGCTGISLNGSQSCAPKAPTSPGLTLTLTTPLGTLSAGPDAPALLQLRL